MTATCGQIGLYFLNMNEGDLYHLLGGDVPYCLPFGVTLNVTSFDKLGRYMGDMPRNKKQGAQSPLWG